MTKVSVIMGAYNVGDSVLLQRAVDSIRNQTFCDWEFIICDDGSIDGTWGWLQEIATQDSRIILVRNKQNHGLASALNKCFSIAQGDYIARQDTDDFSLTDRLEKQVQFLDRYSQYDVVGSRVRLVDSVGVWGTRAKAGEVSKNQFLWGSPFVHPSVMIRSRALHKVNAYRVSKETFRTEDYDLFMRLYATGGKGYNLREELLHYQEDRASYKRRKYRYRVDEAIVRYKGFKSMGLLPRGIVFVIKPLLVGLLPGRAMFYIRKILQSRVFV